MKTMIEVDSVALKVMEKIANFLRQVEPNRFYGSDVDVAMSTMFSYLSRKDYDLPILLECLKMPDTIESMEKMYSRGYSAIINDGKLIGFQR